MVVWRRIVHDDKEKSETKKGDFGEMKKRRQTRVVREFWNEELSRADLLMAYVTSSFSSFCFVISSSTFSSSLFKLSRVLKRLACAS